MKPIMEDIKRISAAEAGQKARLAKRDADTYDTVLNRAYELIDFQASVGGLSTYAYADNYIVDRVIDDLERNGFKVSNVKQIKDIPYKTITISWTMAPPIGFDIL